MPIFGLLWINIEAKHCNVRNVATVVGETYNIKRDVGNIDSIVVVLSVSNNF